MFYPVFMLAQNPSMPRATLVAIATSLTVIPALNMLAMASDRPWALVSVLSVKKEIILNKKYEKRY